jgi:hypothetical protein
MPSYKVLEKGFFKSEIYDPAGKRPILTTDKVLKPVPKWLELMKEPTARKPAKKAPAVKETDKGGKKDHEVKTL